MVDNPPADDGTDDPPPVRPDAAKLFADYEKLYPTYKDLAQRVKAILDELLAPLGSDLIIKARAKAPINFTIKGLRKFDEKPKKYADPIAATPDKAGARVVAPHAAAVLEVVELIASRFDVEDDEDKRVELDADRLGYLGRHLQVRLREADIGKDGHLRGLECEIQIHTIAQSAWATVSHPLLYKPAGKVSKPIQERIYRAVALVSLFDDEVGAARSQILADPMYQAASMFEVLTKAVISWPGMSREEPELSIAVLDILKDTYDDEELASFQDLVDLFLLENGDALRSILSQYAEVSEPPELLFRPEIVAIYERLKNRREAFRAAWIQSDLPNGLFEETAAALGLG